MEPSNRLVVKINNKNKWPKLMIFSCLFYHKKISVFSLSLEGLL